MYNRKSYFGNPFGGFLRHLRKQENIGLRRFARGIGYSATYVSKIERGEVLPTEDFIKRSLRGLGYSHTMFWCLLSGIVPSEIIDKLLQDPNKTINIFEKLNKK